MRYDPDMTLKTCDNHRGGTNNLLTLRTNPVGVSAYTLRADTVITCGSRDHRETERRHMRKLAKLNTEATTV
jgi:hypothetical protein